MKAQHTYDAALYCRLSRDDNNGSAESMSISNQRQFLESYVKEKGWNIGDVYIDDGFSGTTFERPDFQRMVGDIQKGKINMVITKDLSRLGRNYVMTGQYTDFLFPQWGVRYIAINDNFDSASMDNDIAPFKNILNEMYAKDISKKVRSTRVMSAKQGKFMGSRSPYGYIKSPQDRHKLIVDEQAAKIVRRIFALFSDGDSARHIANILNNDGIPCPRAYYYSQMGKVNPNRKESNVWGSSTVMQLLENRAYLGDLVQMRRTSPSFKSKRREFAPEDAWIVIEGTHEPLVDQVTWARVQKRVSSTKRARVTKTGEVSLFSGLVKCADCGSTMQFNTKTMSSGTYRIYKCSRYANNGKSTCSIHSISLETLTEVVLSDIRMNARLAADEEEKLIQRLVKLTNKEQERECASVSDRLKSSSKHIDEINTFIRKLFEEKCAGNMPDSIFKKMLFDYEKELEFHNNIIAEAKASLASLESKEQNISALVDSLRKYARIDLLDRATVVELIDSITVSEQYVRDGAKQQDITINYRFVGCLNS
jgi:DNA invertase Pin-like site-specific DNA recombinase/ribosomal protein L32/K+/H+ antiporter YhaU regulatory subunit KhtT